MAALTAPTDGAWSPLRGWRQPAASAWSITGQPIPPPPAHLLPLYPRFAVLLQSYIALDGGSKLPFAAWVVANGITDPVIVQGMVELYAWHQRGMHR